MTSINKDDLKQEIKIIKSFINNNLVLQNGLAEYLISQDQLTYPELKYYDKEKDEYIKYCELPEGFEWLDRYEEYYPEIYQYYLICDNFLIDDLKEVGATIISDESQILGVDFFCRECCGQSIFLDSVFIDIVINHIARIFFNSNYDLAKKHIHQSFATQSKYFPGNFLVDIDYI